LLTLLKASNGSVIFYKLADVPVAIHDHIGKAYGDSSSTQLGCHTTPVPSVTATSYVGVTAYDA
jgi:hypothetical protein